MAKSRNSDLIRGEKERQDVGFGTKVTGHDTRLINKNGQFNFKLIGQDFRSRLNLYKRLIEMPWIKFGFLIFVLFLIVNFVFATIYFTLGTEHLQGIVGTTPVERYWESFFFSAQTLTTVGYGRISPIGFITSAFAAIESLIGLLAFALATGLLYGKFSRPAAFIRYSDNALIAPYLDTTAFMFRIVNERNHQLIDMSAIAVFSLLETDKKGFKVRRYYNLDLERSQVAFFASNWTIVHPIVEGSPLWNKTEQDLLLAQAETIISLKGHDDSFSQNVHSRNSYIAKEMVWNAKFVNMQESAGKETNVIMNKLSAYEMVN
jgi:inward rectifier potassium channel